MACHTQAVDLQKTAEKNKPWQMSGAKSAGAVSQQAIQL